MKLKEAGNVKRSLRVTANAVQFLNGEECKRHARVPAIMLDYSSPESAHSFAKGERFAFWFKLEDAEWSGVQKQLKPDLRELTIWFDDKELARVKEFMAKVDVKVPERQAFIREDMRK